MTRESTDILVVGGGPAGMSAAVAAASVGTGRVTIVDDNARLGGQIWRADLEKAGTHRARNIIAAIEAGSITVINNARVYGTKSADCLLVETPNGTVELTAERTILTVGARELFLPFPGWTLPGVFGAGGIQALVKGGFSVKGKRVVVSGTGPLLLAVAEYLRSKGAIIPAIVEQAPTARLMKFALGLLSSPTKMLEAAALRRKILSIPYLTNCWVTSASGTGTLKAIELTRKGRRWSIDCDFLACGFHLVPNLELAIMMGCEIEEGRVKVNENQQTSVGNVFCAGESTGIGGLEKALIEGEIAGLGAADHPERASRLFRRSRAARVFAERLNQAFTLRNELKTLADDATIVCRCEDVQYGKLKEFDDWRTAKLQARCGMGSCQGRVCGAAAEFIFGWKPGSVRPPLFPVKLEDL